MFLQTFLSAHHFPCFYSGAYLCSEEEYYTPVIGQLMSIPLHIIFYALLTRIASMSPWEKNKIFASHCFALSVIIFSSIYKPMPNLIASSYLAS